MIIGAGIGYEVGYTEGLSRGSADAKTLAASQTTTSKNTLSTGTGRSSEGQTSTFTTAPTGPIKHIVVIIMENKEYENVVGSPDAAYENALASKYALAGDYFAVSHPSLPNYLALIAGDTFGVASDCQPTDCSFPYATTTITNLLDAHRLSWKEYAESMPVNCSQKTSEDGLYEPKHNPFVYFSRITGTYGDGSTSPYCNSHVVSMDQFWADSITANLPAFSMITPNVCDDAHSCQLSAGDKWLSTYVPLMTNSPSFPSMALFIVYDEGSSGQGVGPGAGGHVVCLLVSPFAKPGYVSSVQT